MEKFRRKRKVGLILLGTFVSILILEIMMRLGGIVWLQFQNPVNKKYFDRNNSYRIMCLGESTTAWGGDDSWPNQLEKILNNKGLGLSFKVTNKGKPGIESSVILSELKYNLDRYNPDMVISMMGINDGDYTIAYDEGVIDNLKIFIKRFRIVKLIKIIKAAMVNRIGIKKSYFKRESNLKIEDNHKGENQSSLMNEDKYLELGEQNMGKGNFKEAEINFKKAIELNPKGEGAYRLGYCYRNQEKLLEAENVIKKGIEVNPDNAALYLELALCFRDQRDLHIEGMLKKEGEMYKKTIEKDPNHDWAYVYLGSYYFDMGRYEDGEKAYIKAMATTTNAVPYIELADHYRKRKDFKNLEKIVYKAVELDNKRDVTRPYGYLSDRMYGLLGLHYYLKGEYKDAKKYFGKAKKIRTDNYFGTTVNYLKLKDMVLSRSLKLVCMQYPMRSIKTLKKIFDFNEKILFVNNEKIFKKVLLQGIYEDYFEDMFAGDFGHCTPKGNRLIAENVANLILKKILKQ